MMLPPNQQDQLLKMQWNAQQQSYRFQFPDAEHHILLRDGQPIGRILVHLTYDEIHLIDISILAEYRSQGIGSYFLKNLQEEAKQANIPLSLNVFKTNHSAFRLYEKLGFRIVSENEIQYEMIWEAGEEEFC